MSYAADFDTARKNFRKIVDPLNPSESYVSFIRIDTARTKADALDKKPKDKEAAAKAYDTAVDAYLKSIRTQALKEKFEQNKVKLATTNFEKALNSISETFLEGGAESEEKESEGEEDKTPKVTTPVKTVSSTPPKSTPPPKPINPAPKNPPPKSPQPTSTTKPTTTQPPTVNKPPTTPPSKTPVPTSGGEGLKLVEEAIKDFTSRRQTHLDAMTDFSSNSKPIVKNIRTWSSTAQNAVGGVLAQMKQNQATAARKIADEAIEAAKNALDAANKLVSDYDTQITKVFQKDRGLGFTSYKLDPSLKGEFVKRQQEAGAIFTKAVSLGTTTLKEIKAMKVLGEQATASASLADTAAKGGDVRGPLILQLTNTEKEVAKLAGLINDDVLKADVGQGVLITCRPVLADLQSKDPTVKSKALTLAPLRATTLSEKLVKLDADVDRLKSLANGVTTSVPAELKKDTTIAPLTEKITKASLEATRAFNEFEKVAETMVNSLRSAK